MMSISLHVNLSNHNPSSIVSTSQHFETFHFKLCCTPHSFPIKLIHPEAHTNSSRPTQNRFPRPLLRRIRRRTERSVKGITLFAFLLVRNDRERRNVDGDIANWTIECETSQGLRNPTFSRNRGSARTFVGFRWTRRLCQRSLMIWSARTMGIVEAGVTPAYRSMSAQIRLDVEEPTAGFASELCSTVNFTDLSYAEME